ncbi:MAG: hypothetical protein Q8R33_00400 [Burkholderiales bacterium]|nr:hypothetical protein [Burkholderiales bacterium]
MSAIGLDRIECARKSMCGILALAPVIVRQLEGLAENGAAMEMVCRIEQLAGLALSAVDDDHTTPQGLAELQRELYGLGGGLPVGKLQGGGQ